VYSPNLLKKKKKENEAKTFWKNEGNGVFTIDVAYRGETGLGSNGILNPLETSEATWGGRGCLN